MVPARLRAVRVPVAAALAGLAGIGLVLAADPTSEGGAWLPPCPIKLLTGLDCPGCGGTRVVWSLLHADLTAALQHNALAVALVPFVLWSWAARFLGDWQGRRPRTWSRWRFAPLVLLALAAVWTVLRNLPFAPFTALRA